MEIELGGRRGKNKQHSGANYERGPDTGGNFENRRTKRGFGPDRYLKGLSSTTAGPIDCRDRSAESCFSPLIPYVFFGSARRDTPSFCPEPFSFHSRTVWFLILADEIDEE